MNNFFDINTIISLVSALVAIIILFYTVYIERKRNRNSQLRVITSLGEYYDVGKNEKDVKLPIKLGVLGVPKFESEDILLTIPLWIKNDSLIALRNIEFNLYYPHKFSLCSMDNKFISNLTEKMLYPNDKIKRFHERCTTDESKVSYFIDYISPSSFFSLDEPITISINDLENGYNVNKDVFKNNEKLIYFPLTAQLFTENHKPVISEYHIYISYSETPEDLQKQFGEPFSRMLAKETYNPFINLKKGIHFFPFPMLQIYKKIFSKYSFVMSQTTIDLAIDKEHKSYFFVEDISSRILMYGNMSYIVPKGNSLLSLLFKKVFRVKK